MIDQRKKLAFASDVVVQMIEGEALILKLHDEQVFSLNETGARIAQLIAEGRSVDGIVEALRSEYDIPRDELHREVIAIVESLLAKRLIVPESPENEA